MKIESNTVAAILLHASRRANTEVCNQPMKVICVDAELSRRFGNVLAAAFQGGTHDPLFRLLHSLVLYRSLDFGWQFLLEQVLVEILGEDIITRAEYNGPLDCVFEFSNISRPIVMNQPRARVRRDSFHR